MRMTVKVESRLKTTINNNESEAIQVLRNTFFVEICPPPSLNPKTVGPYTFVTLIYADP